MSVAYRVLDLTDDKGQFCGRLLADLGCEVIKVEKPGGDPARRIGPFYHDTAGPEMSLFWFAHNRGKKSITLDIETGQGQATLKRLAQEADVLIESGRPGYLDSLGLGYAGLAQINPRIVMASITPFGQSGPYAQYKGPDIVVSALSGFMGMNGDADRAPLNTSVPQVYTYASAHTAQAILLALYHRERTGRGQYIDTCAMQSMTSNIIEFDYLAEYGNLVGARDGNAYRANGIVRTFVSPCKDGYVCFFLYGGAHGAHSNRELQQWMESEGLPEPLFQGMDWDQLDLNTTPPEQVTAICQAFDRFFKTRTRAEIQERAVLRKILMAPCCTVSDLVSSPQLQSRGFWAGVKHPEIGDTILYPGSCARSSASSSNGLRRAPLVGEHNQVISAAPPAAPSNGPSRLDGGIGAPAGAGHNGHKALAGLKVVDFTQAMGGPLATRLLADQGATVVHVESELKIDIYRVTPPYKARKPGINRSLLFGNFQAGKYGLALNMKHPKRAAEILRELVAWADVMVDSRTPGVLEKWGFGYDELTKINPGIILARLTNQGLEGPWASHPGYGTQIIGQAGMIGVLGWPDRDPLMFGRATYADIVASSLFTTYLLEAILHRQNTGKGQHLDVSMVECCLAFLGTALLDYTVNGREIARMGNRRPDAAPHGAYPCSGSDKWCAIAVFSDSEWGLLCAAMGQPGLARDPRFATLAARKANEDELDRLVGAWTSTLAAREVMTTLQAAGVAAGAIQDFREVREDPQLNLRGHFGTVPHSEMGSHTVFGFPYLLSETPCAPPMGAPCLGEHNEYVICQLLGHSDEEFMEMYHEGVFK